LKKSITIIGINFYPEDSSTGLYNTQMAEFLSKKGYNINIITGYPYYPQWKIWDDYKNKPKYLIEKKGDITIYRYKQYVPKNPTLMKRILHLLDFTFGNIINIFKIKESGLVICVVPFTSTIILGLLLSKIRKSKLWVHIQDFEFDAAIDSGLVGKKGIKEKIFKLLFGVERILLNKADIVSTISYGMLNKLYLKTGVSGFYFPNWVNPDLINPKKSKVHPFLKSNKFKVLYSGNIGVKQDWRFFIKVIKNFENNKNIEFIIIGAGAKKEWLLKQIKNLPNVKYYNPVDFSELPNILCSADLHILFQKNDIVDTVMPSKLLGMMVSAKPSIVTGNINSETAKILKESKGGFFFDSDDFENVIENMKKIINDKRLANKIGRNARKYIIKHFSYENVLAKFEKKVREFFN